MSQEKYIQEKYIDIQISDYNYELPDGRIAKYPLLERNKSKLLVYKKGNISEELFNNISTQLSEYRGSLMIFNNTRVIQARLHFQKETGASIEIFCLEPYLPYDYAQNFSQTKSVVWLCLVGNSKKWKSGSLRKSIEVKGRNINLLATKGEQKGNSFYITFEWDNNDVCFSDILESFGNLPIPPYLNREAEEKDNETYQTVYSKIKGSVAAPTAGLHFTPEVIESIKRAGIDTDEVTLHVGAGTFKPVKTENVSEHDMHSEYIVVSKQTIKRIIECGCSVIAVGTTSVRTIESLYHIGVAIYNNPNIPPEDLSVSQWQPYINQNQIIATESLNSLLSYMEKYELEYLKTTTQILIAPPYKYQIVKAIVTNFHQPKSTLLLLVSAFIGDDWKRVYEYALDNDFRFLSYGDSSLLIP